MVLPLGSSIIGLQGINERLVIHGNDTQGVANFDDQKDKAASKVVVITQERLTLCCLLLPSSRTFLMMGCKVFRRYSEILDGGVQFPVFFLKGSVVLNVVSDDFLNLFQEKIISKFLGPRDERGFVCGGW